MTPMPSRGDRRRRSGEEILAAARELFAETGYERTTIRAVAARAGVDPALVMQHYGTKDALFFAASRFAEHRERLMHSSVDTLSSVLATDMLTHFEDSEQGEASRALLRSCFTHEAASELVRAKSCDRARIIGSKMVGDEVELRAAMVQALLTGVAVSRYLTDDPVLREADPDDIARLLETALRVLITPPSEPSVAGDTTDEPASAPVTSGTAASCATVPGPAGVGATTP